MLHIHRGLKDFFERQAKHTAKLLAADNSMGELGTATFIGSAKAAYCVHAKSNYQAIKLAKNAWKARQLREIIF